MSSPLSRFRIGLAILIFGGVALAVTGCGKGVGDVSGTVNYKGSPLKGGFVTLVNTESGPSFTGTINDDGTFVLNGVVSGDYKVCVDTESLKPAGGGGPPTGPATGPPGPGGPGGPGGSGTGGADLYNKAKSGKLKAGPGEGSGGPKGYRDGFTVMAENAAKYIKIPEKYLKPETTDLTFKATRGAQTLNIELKD